MIKSVACSSPRGRRASLGCRTNSKKKGANLSGGSGSMADDEDGVGRHLEDASRESPSGTVTTAQLRALMDREQSRQPCPALGKW